MTFGFESNSVVAGKMTDVCEAAPGAACPCGRENMIDWIDLWQVEMDFWLVECHTMRMHVWSLTSKTWVLLVAGNVLATLHHCGEEGACPRCAV